MGWYKLAKQPLALAKNTIKARVVNIFRHIIATKNVINWKPTHLGVAGWFLRNTREKVCA